MTFRELLNRFAADIIISLYTRQSPTNRRATSGTSSTIPGRRPRKSLRGAAGRTVDGAKFLPQAAEQGPRSSSRSIRSRTFPAFGNNFYRSNRAPRL